MFDYDTALPLDFSVASTIRKDYYSLKDITYESPSGGKVPAYLVEPTAHTLCPAVIFMHPGQGSRESFLDEAVELARRGVVSLLINAPFLRKEFPSEAAEEQKMMHIVETAADIAAFKQTVIDIRRGIDLLAGFTHIDCNRIAYVGHSYGATWGGVVAGVEDRIKAYVLMAGLACSSEWHKTSDHPLARLVRSWLPEERFDRFISALKPLDAVRHIQNAKSSLLFQFAQNDEYVSKEQAVLYYESADCPKTIKWYDTDHLFTGCVSASSDRLRWLIQYL